MRKALKRIAVVATSAALAVAGLPGQAHAAAPTIVTCGFEVFESIVVANSLSGCPGDGLVVRAPKVTIDLAGNLITGSGGPFTNGIKNSQGHSRVTIKNGVIRNFGTGLSLTGNKNRIVGIETYDNKNGIQILGSRNSVRKVIASDNEFDGMALAGDGHVVSGYIGSSNDRWGLLTIGGSGSGFTKSTFSGNGQEGVFVFGGSGHTFKKIEAAHNGSDGMGVADVSNESTGHSIQRSMFRDNVGSGVLISEGTKHVVRQVGLSGNGETGIRVNQGADHKIREVDATGNAQSGIFLFGAGSNHVIRDGRSWGNSLDGVAINGGTGHTLRGTHVSGNGQNGVSLFAGTGHVIDEVRSTGNRFQGMRFDSGGDQHAMKRSVASNNGGQGVLLESGTNYELIGNRADRNGFPNGIPNAAQLGIHAQAGATANTLTAEDNQATANGHPDECSPEANCVPGPEPTGTIVTCGFGVTESIAVANSLFDCPSAGHGLRVLAPDVKIDLGGNTVDGTGITTGSGISNDGAHSNVQIRDGHVRDFHTGILVSAPATQNRLRNLQIRNNSIGVLFASAGLGASGHSVENVTASANAQWGLLGTFVTGLVVRDMTSSANGEGMQLTGGSADVRRSEFSDNDENGVRVQGGTGHIFRGITGSHNGKNGLLMQEESSGFGTIASNGHTLHKSTFRANDESGVLLEDGSDHTLTRVVSSGNGEFGAVGTTGSGVRVLGGSNHTIVQAKVPSNRVGILLSGFGHTVDKSRARGNSVIGFDAGFFSGGSGHTIKRSQASGNRFVGVFLGNGDGHKVIRSKATGNVSWGIMALDGAGHIVKGSVASGNGGDGVILADASGATVVGNKANRNGFDNGESDLSGLGIRVDAGSTNLTASKNKAKGNDAPAECSPAANCV